MHKFSPSFQITDWDDFWLNKSLNPAASWADFVQFPDTEGEKNEAELKKRTWSMLSNENK